MSFHDLFAWFCKNKGTIHCERFPKGKKIRARIRKHERYDFTSHNVDSDEFGAIVAKLIGELHADLS